MGKRTLLAKNLDGEEKQISRTRTPESSGKEIFSPNLDLSLPSVTKFQSYTSGWSIPEEAIENCLCDATGDGCVGFFRIKRGARGFAWYGLPMRTKDGAYNVIRVLHCTTQEKELMFLFHVYDDLTVDSWDIYDVAAPKGDQMSKALYVQIRLVERVLRSYRAQVVTLEAKVKAESTKVDSRQAEMMYSSELKTIHALSSDIRDQIFELQNIQRIIAGLLSHIETNSLVDSLNISQETSIFLQAKLEKLFRTCKRLSKHIEACVNINNTSYIRANVVELRRISHSGVQESAHMRFLAEDTRVDSRKMTRFAVVGVIVLPITLASGIFSTPFFDIDDAGSFKYLQLEKTWVFFISCCLIAFATMIFVYWDSILCVSSYKPHRPSPIEFSEELEKSIIQLHTPPCTPLPVYSERSPRGSRLEPPSTIIGNAGSCEVVRATGFDKVAARSERKMMISYIDDSFALEYEPKLGLDNGAIARKQSVEITVAFASEHHGYGE